MEKKRILVVEDEPSLRRGLVEFFGLHGFETDQAEDGEEGLRLAQSNFYDLVVLDIMLPKLDGFALCRALRAKNIKTAIVMLTARDNEEDLARGFEFGADDFMTKPFSSRELLLRVQAVLKRTSPDLSSSEEFDLEEGCSVNTKKLLLTLSRDGATRELELSRKETEVLHYLYLNRARPVSRTELLTTVWGYQRAGFLETRTVDIHIAKLRKKLERDPKNPRLLLTIRSGGYQLKTFQAADTSLP